jgi:4-aminobutyrate aminotransferase-like enzyme
VWSVLCPELFKSLLQPLSIEYETQLILESRYQNFAQVQQHYFRSPPTIERGFGGFLYDVYGRPYLDMVNNVAVLGHCHPAVTTASTKQIKLLNTNSRFIYSTLGKFCEKILSKFPSDFKTEGKLNRVFLVNSGSEATDLALRIARTVVTERRRRAVESLGQGEITADYTLHRDVICLEGAYHGVTTASDEVSTTLNDNPRALESRAPWIHLVPMPNLFRGKYRLPSNGRLATAEELDKVSDEYAKFVSEKVKSLSESGRPPAAFICEPLSGNAGGVEVIETFIFCKRDL